MIKQLRRSSTVKAVTTLSLGTALGQAVAIAVSPLITRIYTPAELGVLGIYSGIVAVVASVSAFRYEQALPISERHEAAQLFWLSNRIILGVAGMSAVVTLFAANSVLEGHVGQYAIGFVWLIPLGIAFAGGYQVLMAWAIRKEEFGAIGQSKISQGLGLAVVQVLGGLLGMKAYGLMIGDVIGRGGGIGRLLKAIEEDYNLLREYWRTEVKSVAAKYRSHSIALTLATGFNSGSLYLPYFVLPAMFGAEAVGYFFLSQRVVSSPVVLIGKSAASVIYGRVSKSVRGDGGVARGHLVRYSSTVLAAGAVPAVMVIVFAPGIFEIVFGEPWIEAGKIVSVLVPAYLLNMAVVPMSQLFNVLGQQRLQLLCDVFRFSCTGIAFLAAWWWEMHLVEAVMAYSAALVLSHIFLFVVLWGAINVVANEKNGQGAEGACVNQEA